MPTTLNALADISAINAAGAYINSLGKVVQPALFYDKVLLDTIQLGTEHFVHYGLAELRPIQGKAAKLILRRWSPLHAHIIPLSEGIPPKSDRGTAESWEIDTHQYGRYMEFTDLVDFKLIDPVITHYTAQYAIVAVETLDLLAREALLGVPNHYFAGNVTSMAGLQIGATFVPTMDDLRVIILGFKKRLVKPRMGTKYLVLGTPDFFYDLVFDPIVEKFFTINQTTKDTYNNTMVPDLFDMTFKETMAHEDGGEFTTVLTSGGAPVVTRALRVYRLNNAGTAFEYNVAYEKTDAGVATGYLTTETDVYTGDPRKFPNAELNATPLLISWNMDAYNLANAGVGAAWQAMKVHKIILVGKDALIRTEVAGQGNAKMYVKELGSAGVLDPINQRQSIGFKINSVGFGVENLSAVAVYHCVPSQANA